MVSVSLVPWLHARAAAQGSGDQEQGALSEEVIDDLVIRNWPRGEKIAHKDIKMRTFISQEKGRKQLVSHVYDITYGIVEEKDNLVIIDDSIVRGTTSRQIIKLARDAGAKKVYFASAAPPVRFPNVYGIDMPAASELIANGRDEDEIAELIGADRLIYQDLHGLIRSVRHDNSSITEFDASCFSGEYVTGDVTEEYLQDLEERRNDSAKQAREARQKGLFAPDEPTARKGPKPAIGM